MTRKAPWHRPATGPLRSACWLGLVLVSACISDTSDEATEDAESSPTGGSAADAGGGGPAPPDAAGGARPDATTGLGGSGVLVARPEALAFLDGVETQRLALSNVGGGPVTFRQVVLRGDATFAPLLMGLDVRRAPELLTDPDGDGVPGLSPGASFEFEVRHLPDGPGRDLATLVIVPDEGPPLEVPLANDAPAGCLEATPASLSWRTRVGRPDNRTLTLAPCFADIPVAVESLALEGEHADAYRIVRPETGPLRVDTPVVVEVELTPDAPGPRFATLVARASVEGRVFETRVPLEGQGLQNACPVAVSSADVVTAAPLDVVALDGRRSFDPDGPDGRPVRFEWVVLDRPPGSTSQPMETVNPADPAIGTGDDPATPTAEFFVDLPGIFLIELRVTDGEGQRSDLCMPPTSTLITIDARPPANDAGPPDEGPADAAP